MRAGLLGLPESIDVCDLFGAQTELQRRLDRLHPREYDYPRPAAPHKWAWTTARAWNGSAVLQRSSDAGE
jgi:hypothetical protein